MKEVRILCTGETSEIDMIQKKHRLLDEWLAYTTFVLGIGLLFISFKIGTGTGLSLTAVVASLSYLYLNRKNEYLLDDKFSINYTNKFYLVILFSIFTLTTYLIYSIEESSPRNINYFVYASIISGIIAIQAYSFKKYSHSMIVILQIILFSTFMIFSAIVIYPHIGSDQLFHHSFMLKIIDNSYIWNDNIYGYFPLMHLGLVITALLSSIYDPQLILIAFVTTPYLLLCGALFLVGRLFFEDKKSVFAIIFIVLNIWYASWGFYSIPMTYSFSIFLIGAVVFYKSIIKKCLPNGILLLLLMATIIISHPVASLSFSVFLLVTYFTVSVKKYLEMDKIYYMKVSLLLLFSVALIGYWIFSAQMFFEGQIRSLFIDSETTIGVLKLQSQKSVYVYEYDYISTYIIYIFYAFGIFRWIKEPPKNILKYAVLASSLTFLFIAYSAWILGIQTIIPHRWLFYAAIFISFPAAEGFLWALTKLKTLRVRNIAIFTTIFLLTFTTLTSSIINVDSPLLGKDDSIRLQLKTSEVTSAKFTTSTFDGTIYSDFLIWQYFTNTLKLPFGRNLLLGDEILKNNGTKNSAIVIRNYVFYQPVQRPTYRLNADLLSSITEREATVYNNGEVLVLRM